MISVFCRNKKKEEQRERVVLQAGLQAPAPPLTAAQPLLAAQPKLSLAAQPKRSRNVPTATITRAAATIAPQPHVAPQLYITPHMGQQALQLCVALQPQQPVAPEPQIHIQPQPQPREASQGNLFILPATVPTQTIPTLSVPYATKRNWRRINSRTDDDRTRTYKRQRPYNLCKKCGLPSQAQTGHRRFHNKVYCPSKEGLPFDEWKKHISQD